LSRNNDPLSLSYGIMSGMTAIAAVMAATDISAPMTPYSIAVAPSSWQNSLARIASTGRSSRDEIKNGLIVAW
jgi:hypothetical protein